MDVNAQAPAIMLLTVSLGKSSNLGVNPLSAKEWGRFAGWLKEQGLEPSVLLKGDIRSLLSEWMDPSVTLPRIESLLNRGSALGLALERWQRAGLWVITRADADYPARLKQRLRSDSPPVLFGCGDRALLKNGGLAVVGSREANEDDLVFTEYLGVKAAEQGYAIVSGGARGVDQRAMFAALQGEGRAVGVLADSLLRSATSAKYRNPLLSGNLVLVSPNNPELGFDVAKAMSRNRYIYCLADAAIVISSKRGKGGTWNGALEGVKEGWVPVWVKPSSYASSGNSDLVAHGAHWLPETLDSIASLPASPAAASPNGTPPIAASLFDGDVASSEVELMRPTTTRLPQYTSEVSAADSEVAETQTAAAMDQVPSDIGFYDLFLIQLTQMTSITPLTSAEIAENLNVAKTQIDTWLKRGISDNVIRRHRKPVRYQANANGDRQAMLLSAADL